MEFWDEKVRRNRERDERKICELESLGWRVLVVWECELKGKAPEGMDETVRQIRLGPDAGLGV